MIRTVLIFFIILLATFGVVKAEESALVGSSSVVLDNDPKDPKIVATVSLVNNADTAAENIHIVEMNVDGYGKLVVKIDQTPNNQCGSKACPDMFIIEKLPPGLVADSEQIEVNEDSVGTIKLFPLEILPMS